MWFSVTDKKQLKKENVDVGQFDDRWKLQYWVVIRSVVPQERSGKNRVYSRPSRYLKGREAVFDRPLAQEEFWILKRKM